MRMVLAIFLCSIVVAPAIAPSAAHAAEILYVMAEGNGYSEVYQTSTGWNGDLGRWDCEYANGYGCDNPGGSCAEPIGPSRMEVVIDVAEGGQIIFDWSFFTWDNKQTDTLDAYIYYGGVKTFVISGFGNPAACPGALWSVPRKTTVVDLAPWAGKTVSFNIDVWQDGFGDQTQGRVRNLEIGSCPVPPLTPLSADPMTQYLESHGGIETDHLSQAMKDALQCLMDQALQAGGVVNLRAGYRTQEYQLHIREVWEKDRKLRTVDSAACDALRQALDAELAKHGPFRHRPAGSAGFHTKGTAIDVSFGGPIDGNALAHLCGLCRPLPLDDKVHFELCSGGRCSCTP